MKTHNALIHRFKYSITASNCSAVGSWRPANQLETVSNTARQEETAASASSMLEEFVQELDAKSKLAADIRLLIKRIDRKFNVNKVRIDLD